MLGSWVASIPMAGGGQKLSLGEHVGWAGGQRGRGHGAAGVTWLPVAAPAANKNAVEAVQYGVEGSTAFLECQPRSPQASVKWLLQKDNSDRRKEVGQGVLGGAGGGQGPVD